VDRKLTETKLLQLEFWEGLVEFSTAKGTFLRFQKPRPQNWYVLAVGRAGFHLSLTTNTSKRRIGCELYIPHEMSKEAFAQLSTQRDDIQKELGSPLEWQELPLKKACRIVQYHQGDLESRERWPELFSWLKERAEIFYKVFSPRVKALELEGENE